MERIESAKKLWNPLWSRIIAWISIVLTVPNFIFGSYIFTDGLSGGWLYEIALVIGVVFMTSSIVTLILCVTLLKFKRIGWFIGAILPVLITFLLSFSIFADYFGLQYPF